MSFCTCHDFLGFFQKIQIGSLKMKTIERLKREQTNRFLEKYECYIFNKKKFDDREFCTCAICSTKEMQQKKIQQKR